MISSTPSSGCACACSSARNRSCAWRATSPPRTWTARSSCQRAEALISQYPELQAITWIDERGRVRASHAAPTVARSQVRVAGEVLKPGATADNFGLTRDLQQPVYAPACGRPE